MTMALFNKIILLRYSLDISLGTYYSKKSIVETKTARHPV